MYSYGNALINVVRKFSTIKAKLKPRNVGLEVLLGSKTGLWGQGYR